MSCPRLLSVKIIIIIILISATAGLFSFGKNKVNLKSYDWQTMDAAHCRIYYHKPQRKIAKRALRYAELLILQYQKKLKHDLSQSIPILLFPSHAGFEENNLTAGSVGERTGGFTELLRCRIVIPHEGDWTRFRRVLAHEMVHAFQFDVLYGRRGNPFGRIFLRTPPLWFLEGMAEYLSLGWDSQTESIIRDAVLNNTLPGMKALTALRIHPKQYFLVYKQGQAFLHYLRQRYGKGIIGTLLATFRSSPDPDRVLNRVCGSNLKKISDQFLKFLKNRYYPHIRKYGNRSDCKTGMTDHLKDGSSINILPAVSPNGKYYAYLSNPNFFPCIFLSDYKTGKKIKRIAISWRSGDYTGLMFDGNRIAWSPNSKKVAFLTRTPTGHAVSVHSVPSGKRIFFKQLPEATSAEPHFGRDDLAIRVLSYSDGCTLVRRYPLDGKKPALVFRFKGHLSNPRNSTEGVLYLQMKNSKNRLVLQQKNSGTIIPFRTQVTEGIRSFDILNDILIFQKDQQGHLDLWKLNLKTGKSGRLTGSSGYAGQPSLHPDGKELLFTEYRTHGYDIIKLKTTAITNIRNITPGLWKKQQLLNYDRLETNFRPLVRNFTINPYKPSLKFDIINGIIGFNSQAGLRLIGQTSMSDMMGDRRLTLTLDTALSTSSDSTSSVNAICNFYLLKGKNDLITGLFHYSSSMFIYDFQMILNNAFIPLPDEKRAGGYVLFRQPFSRYSRLDISWTSMHFSKYYIDYDDTRSGNLHILQLSYSFDNTAWGIFGPMDGIRFRFSAANAFDLWGDDWQFQQLDADFRAYLRFFRRYALAFRLNGGIVRGKDSRMNPYETGGFYTVRGFPFFSIRGDTMLLANLELRFPFIDLLALGFPIPLKIARIHGVIFCDAGAAWYNDSRPVFWRKENGDFRFVDMRLSYGVGFRFLIGPIRIRWDFAAPYDGTKPRPLKRWLGMFSLGMDF